MSNRNNILTKVKERTDLTKKDIEFLQRFDNVHKRSVEIEHEGNLHKFKAFRAQHNNSLGPYKGGIRFHPKVNENEVKDLAFWMSMKTSLVGLPFGGAKGGVQINTRDFDDEILKKVSQEYVKVFSRHLGSDKDIPAPDAYTSSKEMGWMLDKFESIKARKEPGFITGKPRLLGGSSGRNVATGKGGFFVLQEALQSFENKTFAIQGFGNVGRAAATFIQEAKGKIIAVSDSSTAIYNKNGLNISELKKFKDDGKSFEEHQAQKISNEELLSLECDVLIPAALSDVITKNNANNIKTKLILELANGPITSEAQEILQKNKVIVIPDILGNSGGVIVSYFEWVQNKTSLYWEEEEVFTELQKRITDSYLAAKKLVDENNVSFRLACYIIASERIIKAAKLRGRI